MNDAALFASRLAEANAAPAFRQDATPEVLQPVGQSRMSPEAREDAARRAGVAAQAWLSKYLKTKDLKCLEMVCRHFGQELAIRKGANE